MTECKDCLHYKVCADLADQFIKTFPDPSANGCENFKDGSHFAEVVRCKDCKEYNGHRYCNYFAQAVLDGDFCSYGKRRMGNG